MTIVDVEKIVETKQIHLKGETLPKAPKKSKTLETIGEVVEQVRYVEGET